MYMYVFNAVFKPNPLSKYFIFWCWCREVVWFFFGCNYYCV